MATKIVMEALSPTMEEGRLVEWKKREGEPVAVGDVLAEVETDKAVMELVARGGGMLLRQLVPAGATVPVSAPIGWIGQPGETVPDEAGRRTAGPAGPRADEQPSRLTDGHTGRRAEEASRSAGGGVPSAVALAEPSAPAAVSVSTPLSTLASLRVKSSPMARRLASERGLDLTGIAGSGPEGRITKRDVEAVRSERLEVRGPIPAAPLTSHRLPLTVEGAAFRDVPLTQIRKTIAKRLAQSIGPIPTFYLTSEIDMERAWDAREALKTQLGESGKVSFNDIVLKAVATTLRQHLECNAWWQDDHIRYWNEVHIGVAVAVEDGLITPVIRHADRKSLREISTEVKDLAERARARKLKPEEYTGASFSISNLGMYDIEHFTAVINPPEAGILAVGSIVQVPVVVDGQLAARRRMRVTMSCDHRVVDGATGARFLHTLKLMLENPLALVW